jgi:hypothetical protein
VYERGGSLDSNLDFFALFRKKCKKIGERREEIPKERGESRKRGGISKERRNI